MKKEPQFEKFEIGIISIFTGLAFLTIVPVIMKALHIFVDADIYRIFGGFFLVLASILFILSPLYYKKQLVILGFNFIIFSFFQFYFTEQTENFSLLSKYLSMAFGIFLLILGIYLDKIKAD